MLGQGLVELLDHLVGIVYAELAEQVLESPQLELDLLSFLGQAWVGAVFDVFDQGLELQE